MIIKYLKLLLRHLKYHPIAIGVWVRNCSKIGRAQTDTADLAKPTSLDPQDVYRKSV